MKKVRILFLAAVLACLIVPSASFAASDEAAVFTQGKKHYQDKSYYFASTWLERVLNKYPTTQKREEVLLMLARCYAGTSREEKAVRTLNTLLKDFPQAAGKLDPDLLALVRVPVSEPPKLAEPQRQAQVDKAAPTAAGVAPLPAAAPASEKKGAAAAPVAALPPVAQEGKGTAPVVTVTAATAPQARDAASVPTAQPAPVQPAAPVQPTASVQPTAQSAAPAPPTAPLKPAAAATTAASTATAEPLSSALRSDSGSKTAAAGNGPFCLDFGSYVLKKDLVPIKKKIRKAGLVPVVTPGPKRKEQMSRILVGEYAEKSAADKMLRKLHELKAEQFVLQDVTGKFGVYAGSYFDRIGAVDEQLRLAGFGITTELRQVSVQVPTYALSAGSFKSRNEADLKEAELERLGVKGDVVRQAR